MAATRLRLSREYRNGRTDFARFKHVGEFVACNGEKDLGAYHAAFEILLEEEGFTRKEIAEYRAHHKPPSHD